MCKGRARTTGAWAGAGRSGGLAVGVDHAVELSRRRGPALEHGRDGPEVVAPRELDPDQQGRVSEDADDEEGGGRGRGGRATQLTRKGHPGVL